MSAPRPLRARLEAPIERVTELKDRTLAAFPVRVWRNFAFSNGFLLSAGMSYYVLFALFALLYVGFAGAGLWLGASSLAIEALVRLVNTYIPGLIAPEGGLFSVEDVTQIAQDSTGILGVTGAIAVGVALWTAVSAVTFTRRAVRDLFGLPFDARPYWLLKMRDFFAAIVFGGAMLVGAVLISLSVWALEQIFLLFDWSTGTWFFSFGAQTVSVVVAFALDATALAMLVRFLTGTHLHWRFIWPGAMLGGGAMVVLQLGAGLLLSHVPSNPLLASFTVIIGLLLWCRWLAIVVLMAASWIAVAAEDKDQPLEREDEATARRAEKQALLLAARVQVRRAQEAVDTAPWYRRPAARRALKAAQQRLTDARADAEADAVTTGNVRPRP
ncbi:YihY/virulence factor BrkB family protein [Microbacterium galbinum]|uniref:YihY/virulence factor BrkB family protein n=1 Tax=Microbacterium galbinum TaxID=2851646 RepID=A0ABY4IK94_9MICO|nr:YihY/virulence factor BrkB family protein [Microbacterium galbinum]UPL13170.1 YihY/virulence factor BrkB family protein [Microbacterium galbinum]